MSIETLNCVYCQDKSGKERTCHMSCAIKQLNSTKRRKGGESWTIDMIKCREPCGQANCHCEICMAACPDDCIEHMDERLFKCPVCVGNKGDAHVKPKAKPATSSLKKVFTIRNGKKPIKSPNGEDSYVFDRESQQQFTFKKGVYLEGYAFAKKHDYCFNTLEEAQRAVLGSKRKRIGGITAEYISADGFSSE